MTTSLLRDALGHHAWATVRLLDVAADLTDEQLATNVPGTYGSIIDTLRHLVDSDCWYLSRLTGDETLQIDVEPMGGAELRTIMERNSDGWRRLAETEIDPDEIVVVRREDGSEARSTKGIRMTQVLHHGTDHRSQVCTALTVLGLEPPEIDAWDYGLTNGRLVVTEAP
jgi:uncharacterized damage-inducible protein DinB